MFSRRGVLASSAALAAHGLLPLHSGLAQDATAAAESDLDALLKKLRKRSNVAHLEEAVIEALAVAGVPSYEAPTDTHPIIEIQGAKSTVAAFGWQIGTMATEISARSGRTPAELDSLMNLDSSSVVPSKLLAAYLGGVESDGATIARAICGIKNSDDFAISCPLLAQYLLLGEMLRDLNAEALHPVESLMAPVQYAGVFQESDMCQQVAAWVALLLSRSVGSLRDYQGSIPDTPFFGALSQALLAIGIESGENRLELSQQSIDQMYASIITLVISTQVLTLIQPWSVQVEPDPASNRFGVDDELVNGDIFAIMRLGTNNEWPTALAECAHSRGIDLPSPDNIDARAHWDFVETPIPLIQNLQYSVTDSGGEHVGTRNCKYQTMQESSSLQDNPVVEGTVEATISVRRRDLDSVRDALLDALAPDLPRQVKDFYEPVGVELAQTDILDRIRTLRTASGTTRFVVTYHDPEAGNPDQGDFSCAVGTWNVQDLAQAAQAMFDTVTDAPEMTFTHKSGSSELTIQDNQTFIWKFDNYVIDGESSASEAGTVSTLVTFNGDFSGSVELDVTRLVVNSDANTMDVSADVYLNGSLITSVPVGDRSWWSTGSVLKFRCSPDSDKLVLIPTIADGVEIAVERL